VNARECYDSDSSSDQFKGQICIKLPYGAESIQSSWDPKQSLSIIVRSI
jgi:hypothetical protein